MSSTNSSTPDFEEASKPKIPSIDKVIPHFDGKRWFQLSHLRKLSWAIFVVSLTGCNNGYDGSLLNCLYSESDFNNAIGNVSGAVLGALTNGYALGCVLAFYPAPYLADHYGRIPALNIGNIVMIIGVVIQSCAGTWYHHGFPENNTSRDVLGMLIAARIVIGVGVGIISVAAPSLISELSFPTHRQVCSTYYNSSWYLGAIVASWVSYGTRNVAHHWNWRIPSIVQSFFPLAQLILTNICVPESPRFYVGQGQVEKAREVLEKWHGGGYEGSKALVDYEMTEMQLAIQQEKLSLNSSYKDFFRTKANRKRLWIVVSVAAFMQLSGNGLVSYYLSMVLDTIGIHSSDEKLVVNGGLMIYNWGVSVITACFVIPRMTRRGSFLTSIGGMLVTFVIWTVLSAINQKRNFEDHALAQGVLAMIFVFYLFYNWGLNGLPITYITEILPFSLRGKGVNIWMVVMYLCIVYNGFVNPVAMDAISWRYYIVWCCILAVEWVAVALTYVETSGCTLEEVAAVFGDAPDLSNVAIRDDKEKPEHLE